VGDEHERGAARARRGDAGGDRGALVVREQAPQRRQPAAHLELVGQQGEQRRRTSGEARDDVRELHPRVRAQAAVGLDGDVARAARDEPLPHVARGRTLAPPRGVAGQAGERRDVGG